MVQFRHTSPILTGAEIARMAPSALDSNAPHYPAIPRWNPSPRLVAPEWRSRGPACKGVLPPLECPTCASLGLISTFVIDDGNSRTVLPGARRFWYLGVFHAHDPNIATGWWHCTQGHNGIIDYGNRCASSTMANRERLFRLSRPHPRNCTGRSIPKSRKTSSGFWSALRTI